MTNPGFRIDSYISLNAVIHVSSLNEAEMGPVNRLSEDIEIICLHRNVIYRRFDIHSKDEFFVNMFMITDLCYRLSIRPILHFDMHATKSEGLVIQKEGVFISWREIHGLLKRINIITKCNLVVIFASCFSFNVISEIEITKPSPYFILIAPRNELKIGDMQGALLKFYEDVFYDNNIIEPYRKHLSRAFTLLHAEKFLVQTIARYFKQSCMGKGKQERIENLISTLITNGANSEAINLSSARKLIRKNIKPSQAVLDKYASEFLVGRKCNINISNILELLR